MYYHMNSVCHSRIIPQHLRPRTSASQRLRQHCSENPRHSVSQQSRGISNIKTLIPQFLRPRRKAVNVLQLERTVAYGLYIGFYGSVSFSDLIRTDMPKSTLLAVPQGDTGQNPGALINVREVHDLRNSILPLAGVTMRAAEKVKPHVRNLNKGAMR